MNLSTLPPSNPQQQHYQPPSRSASRASRNSNRMSTSNPINTYTSSYTTLPKAPNALTTSYLGPTSGTGTGLNGSISAINETGVKRRASSVGGRSGRSQSRASSSGLSRTQSLSLIKKNIELQDLKPADVLIERFQAWKAIVKQLGAYFEGIADIENNTARELTKLSGVIQVPFRAGNQFLGEGGLQDIYFSIRDKTRLIADQHADLGRSIDSSIVQHLNKLKVEIKAHIKNIQNDTGKLAAGVARERELSTKLVGELANSISTFKNTPMAVKPTADPYVANQAVHRQLARQVVEENLLHKSLLMMQQNSAHFEAGIVKSLQSAWATYHLYLSRSSHSISTLFTSVADQFSSPSASFTPETEWIQFAARSDHLVHPDTPLRDVEAIKYPLMDEPSVRALHTGYLERKRRFTRSWGEGYYVLTPAGYLHEYALEGGGPAPNGSAAGQGKRAAMPTFSLFLPNCTLGPASSPRATQHKFHIEGRKDGMGNTKSGSFKAVLGGLGSGSGSSGESSKAWTFKARSHDEMMEWWNDIRMLCARYLVASEQVDRTGPVEEAVRGVGYDLEEWESESGEEEELEEEEEEEGEEMVDERGRTYVDGEAPPPVRIVQDEHDDEDGSSVEEEVYEHGDEHEHEQPPVYTHPTGEKYPGGLEIGPHGYAIEKKTIPHTNGDAAAYPPAIPTYHDQPDKFHASPNLVHNHSYSEVRSQRAIVDGVQAPLTPNEEYDQPHVDAGEGDEQGGKLGRRLSQRQMEKLPEHAAEERGAEREGLPPPIQLRDEGFVPSRHGQGQGQRQSKRQDSASRHRSPPPPEPEAHSGNEEDEDEEDMYVEDVDHEEAKMGHLKAGDEEHDSKDAGVLPMTTEKANGNGHAVPASKSPTPAPAQTSSEVSGPVLVGDQSHEVEKDNAAATEGSGTSPKKSQKKKSKAKKSMVESISEAVGLKARDEE